MTWVGPPPVQLNEAMRLASAGQPWVIRLENTRSRRAFWEVRGSAPHYRVVLRWGRIGSAGQTKLIPFRDVAKKVSQKLAGDYEYHRATNGTVPVAAQPAAQRVHTLRDRLGNTTMRPTTMEQVWERIGSGGWVRQQPDADYTGIFKGCTALSLWMARDGRWWVVVAYGDEYVLGVVAEHGAG
jgi:predicted DNA-binding WGR domain protein